jgi:hypothetical protein
MFDRRILIAAAFTAALFTAGGAFAQGQAIVGIQTVTTYSSEGRISSVDPNARTVTIIFPDGATRTHNVSPAVANFGSTRIGDTVSVGFEDKLTFVLSGPGTKTPRDRDTTLTAATSAARASPASARRKPSARGGSSRSIPPPTPSRWSIPTVGRCGHLT